MASEKELSELGRLLAAAWSYQVLSRDGRYVGLVDHVRYERHSDHPDEIVVRRRNVSGGADGWCPSPQLNPSIQGVAP